MIIKRLGIKPYIEIWEAMKEFTASRNENTPDEIWLLQHQAVYTQGIGGKSEHILKRNNIPIVQIDRGGQITYHAEGQIMMYVLLDIKRRGCSIRELVTMLENSVINTLAKYFQQEALARKDAPGVYWQGKKIASLGLKVSRGCTYHGLALNVAMDLKPFSDINPCGLLGMKMAQIRDFSKNVNISEISDYLANEFLLLWEKN